MATRIVQIDDLLDAAVFDRYGAGDRAARPLRPITLEVLQSRIPDDRTAVLEYLLGESRSILFCIKKDSFDLIELPPAREIDDALSGYLSYLEDPSISVRKGLPAAQRLCRMLLTPALRSLPARVDRLVIVPDGVLFRLPFEALALPAPDATEPVYVNDRFALSYAPSASSLDPSATGRDARYDKDALAFGVSKYPRRARLAGGSTPLSPSTILDDIYGRRGFAIERVYQDAVDQCENQVGLTRFAFPRCEISSVWLKDPLGRPPLLTEFSFDRQTGLANRPVPIDDFPYLPERPRIARNAHIHHLPLREGPFVVLLAPQELSPLNKCPIPRFPAPFPPTLPELLVRAEDTTPSS